MKSNSLRYLLREGLRNVWNNKLMSLASIGVLTTCLLLVGFTAVLSLNVDNMIGYVEQQSDLVIFLQDDATQEQTNDMMKDLEEMSCVETVTYVSKEQALADYTSSLNDPALVEGLGDDLFLPASFRVSTNDVSQIGVVVEEAQSHSCFDSVSTSTDAAETIASLKQTVAIFGIAIILALIIISLVIIANTIRATVFTRRMEIGIMKQVGATDNFIRIPFLVEGMALGTFSAIIAFVVIWIGYEGIMGLLMTEASSFLTSMYQSITPFSHIAWILALAFLVGGILTGAIGSVVSLRRHLHV